jgi:DNA-binding transcriptional ArsR family regulator
MNKEANKLARWLKFLSVGTRVRIVQLLKGRALCVNALAHQLDVTQSAVSQHLRVLRAAGLVIDEKRGYYVHYRLNEETFAEWKEAIDHMLDTKFENCSGKKGNQKCAAATKAKKDARSRKT